MLNGLRSYYADTLTSASYLLIVLYAAHLDHTKGWLIGLGLVAIIAFFAWASTYKRVRTIADIATSRIGSAAQGYVELYGRASKDPINLIRSPLNGISCVWFRYWVYERHDNGWAQTDTGVSDSTFEIEDGTGSCVIDPDYAEVIASDRRESQQNGYKYVEEILYPNSVYVLGEFSTIGGANSVLNLKEDVSQLLAEWKKDPVALKKRFDLDGDGEVDLREWEHARREATRKVQQEHREIRSQLGVHVMRAPRDRRLYLLSSLSPQKLRQRYVWWSLFHLTVLLVAIGAFLKFSF